MPTWASMSDDSMVVLIARARRGEKAALGELLELYRSYISLLARVQIDRRLRGRVASSDLVQETILEASRRFAGFRGNSEGELIGWLRQVLASQVARMYRHHSARLRDYHLERQLGIELDHSSQLLVQSLQLSSPSRSAIQREEVVLLADALEELPAHYREVILLRSLEDLSFDVVAERMDRTTDSVRKLWARALAKLEDLVSND